MIRINGPFERKDRKTTSYRLKVTDRETGRAWTGSVRNQGRSPEDHPEAARRYRRPVGINRG